MDIDMAALRLIEREKEIGFDVLVSAPENVGEIDLDLTRVVDPEELDGRTVEVELEVAGRIEVTVPRGVDVTVRSRVEIGDHRVFGDDLDEGDDRTTTLDGGPGAPELELDVRTAFGEIEIVREGAVR